MIPFIPGNPRMQVNMEDGVVLADAELRAKIAERFPACWGRIEGRRRFLAETLGFSIGDELLPLCERQGAFAPALLSLNTVMKA
jgi:hypothetical protein